MKAKPMPMLSTNENVPNNFVDPISFWKLDHMSYSYGKNRTAHTPTTIYIRFKWQITKRNSIFDVLTGDINAKHIPLTWLTVNQTGNKCALIYNTATEVCWITFLRCDEQSTVVCLLWKYLTASMKYCLA